ncbi:lysophospholipid acyltransferase family protein [Streptomyces sp. PmtG]
MNPWTVEAGCPRSHALPAAYRVAPAEAVRRYAALSCELARGLGAGERLADGDAVRERARGVLRALGVGLEAGPLPLSVPGGGAGTLVVANHISWLDVVALLAVEPVAFVAKREVARWPVVGTLARRLGTQFIDREGGRHTLPLMVGELAKALAGGRSVLVFPQATTWCVRLRRAVSAGGVPGGRGRGGGGAAGDGGVPDGRGGQHGGRLSGGRGVRGVPAAGGGGPRGERADRRAPAGARA